MHGQKNIKTGPTVSVDMVGVHVVVRTVVEGRDCVRFENLKYN